MDFNESTWDMAAQVPDALTFHIPVLYDRLSCDCTFQEKALLHYGTVTRFPIVLNARQPVLLQCDWLRSYSMLL